MIAVRASATASPSSASSLGGIIATGKNCLQPDGGIRNTEGADRAGGAFQRMRQRTRIRRQTGKRADQFGRLCREHRKHFLLKPGIAKRHAFEMFEIDRAVIGGERRRWHPFYPFEMKRHGLTQISLPYRFRAGPFWSANHETG